MTAPVAPSRTNRQLAALLPWPAPDANKYTRGKLVLVAGSAAFPGAACLAAAAGERAGAGYTEVYCAGKAMITVRASRPSLVVRDWRGWHPGRALRGTSSPAPGTPGGRPGHPEACVIGCGMDAADASCTALVMETVRAFAGPLLVDGGALGLLACETGLRLARERAEEGLPLVLTPHGGEAARLARAAGVGPEPGDPSPSPLPAADLAQQLARAFHAVVALKGPDTYIADADGTVEVMDRGTAALAKAGTGDVLAGIVGALLAQRLAPRDAAALGCALHAEAGRIAADALTAICASAEDVVEALPGAIRAVAE